MARGGSEPSAAFSLLRKWNFVMADDPPGNAVQEGGQQRAPIIPDAALHARQMYAEGVPTRTILAETGLTLWQLYNWIEGRPRRNAEPLLPALAKRRVVKGLRISAGDRRSLVARMMRSAERQVAEIELRVGSPRNDREKDARMLAVLARAMRELSTIDALDRRLEEVEEVARDDDNSIAAEPVPRDIEELRRSVSRKLQQIIDGRAEGSAGDS
jgi:hypothetical protein